MGPSITYVLDQLDGVLVNSQIDDRSVPTNVEDGVKVGSVDIRELDRVLDELLGLFVLEELGSEFIGLESLN
jgi:hypothetical protein